MLIDSKRKYMVMVASVNKNIGVRNKTIAENNILSNNSMNNCSITNTILTITQEK